MSDETPTDGKATQKPKCGIIMPISEIEGLPASHWLEVRSILSDAINDGGFHPELVSDAEEVAVIQKTIIQNLYDNAIVVCDVSAKNPNVMFELGMRLAFDKPTIIVKDDKTAYSFDTAQIEHLPYPRDLRFTQIVDFKARLADKVRNTHKKATEDPNYTTFLKHFGEFKVAKIDQTEVPAQQYILEELRSLKESVIRLDKTTRTRAAKLVPPLPAMSKLWAPALSTEDLVWVRTFVTAHRGEAQIEFEDDTLTIRTRYPLTDLETERIRNRLLQIQPEDAAVETMQTDGG